MSPTAYSERAYVSNHWVVNSCLIRIIIVVVVVIIIILPRCCPSMP